MITLDNTTTSLEVVLAAAVTTNQLPIVASFADKTALALTPVKQTSQTNGTSTVTIVAAPAASTQREVHSLNIYNADTVAATITVRENDNGTLRILVKVTLAVADTLTYTHADGWKVTDSSGNLKTSATGGGGTPGGATTQVQFNDAGTFGGDADLTWNKTTNVLTINGNLTFTGAARRIIADFSATTPSDRTAFQTSTVNGFTLVGVLPNGTSTTSYFAVANNSDANNASYGLFEANSTGINIHSTITGGGTALPLGFLTGSTKRLDILANGAWSVGSTGTATGTAGQVLTSNGAASPPTWGAVSLTIGVSGTLPVANGGTGATTSTGTGSTVLSADPALTGNPTAPTAAENDSDTSIATTAFVNANQSGTWSSIGNTSKNNSGTPNTQFDLTADVVILRNTNNHVVTRYAPGTITNNVSTAGSTANGRDQAGSFSASSWIHFYWIWNGTTLSSLSSTVAPTTGPTLPTGYTHWAYCGAVRFDSGSALLKTYFKGSRAFYQLVQNVGSFSAASDLAETAIDISTNIPPNALSVIGALTGYQSITIASNYQFILRVATGVNYCTFVGVVAALSYSSVGGGVEFPNVGQNVYAVSTHGGGTVSDRYLQVDIMGYTMPNGGG